MREDTEIIFPDRSVTYDKFTEDLSERIARALRRQERLPERLSQRQAYRMFGRGNVDRWRRNGQVSVQKRPGKVEYITAELQELQAKEQDYL